MTLTVTHSFVSGVADDPTAAAAGEVLPSHWNANHVVTGVALQVAASNLTFFVKTTGSDSNDGLTLATAFATIQHAVTVALGYDYQGIYKPTIMLADGTYHESIIIPNNPVNAASTGGYSLEIQSTSGIPANVLIAPNSGADTDAFAALNGLYHFDGFTVVADPGNTTGNDNIIKITNAVAGLNNININTGSTSTYANWFGLFSFARAFTNGSMVISGNGANSAGFTAMNFARLGYFGPIVFSSVINMGGATVFTSSQNSNIDVSNSIPFTTPGNVTNGVPLVLNLESTIALLADPVTVTWPGGAFDPTQIDGGSNIDGNFYTHKYAGAPVDETSIYRSSWQIHKDSNQTTAGLGLNLFVDDAGTVVPLIALTPAPGNLTFYVATTGSDSNPGTSGSPFATIQHAVSVLLGFDYQTLYQGTVNIANGTYHETVNVTSGLFNGKHSGTNASGFITGNPSTPTNVKISPNNGTGNPMFTFSSGGFWQLDGVDLVADSTVLAGAGGNMIYVNEAAVLNYGTINFETGTVQGYQNCFNLLGNATAGGGAGSGSGAVTFSGTGVFGQIFRAVQFSEFDDCPSFVFNSAMTIPNTYFANRNAFFLFANLVFVNLANVTASSGPFSVGKEAFLFLFGTDPTTVTWPGGTFNPTGFDALANADGFPYVQQIAGPPTDQSTIYRGSWLITKDTTNGPRSITYDDAGTIYTRQIGRFINTQTSTNYTLQLFDQDGRVEMNNAGANTVTVPSSATVNFPIGTEIHIVQVGAGSTTPSTSVVTIHGVAALGGQWKSALLYKRGADEWVQTSI